MPTGVWRAPSRPRRRPGHPPSSHAGCSGSRSRSLSARGRVGCVLSTGGCAHARARAGRWSVLCCPLSAVAPCVSGSWCSRGFVQCGCPPGRERSPFGSASPWPLRCARGTGGRHGGRAGGVQRRLTARRDGRGTRQCTHTYISHVPHTIYYVTTHKLITTSAADLILRVSCTHA